MRNKLGDQVVGTGWKGRMVLRAYKKPANPQTCSQTANRDHQDKVLKLYQTNIKDDAELEAMWNEDALPRRISGFNLFMMLGRSSRIDFQEACVQDAEGTGHYTVKTDLASAGIYAEYFDPGAVFDEVIAVGEMDPGEDVEFNYTPTHLGYFNFYIVDGRSKTIPPVDADRSALVNMWSLDEETDCKAVPATCTVTES
jgi:hypothetical protein